MIEPNKTPVEPVDPSTQPAQPASVTSITAMKKRGAETIPPVEVDDAETTLDRAESLPDQTQPAPRATPSQAADDLDALLESAIAPEDDDVELGQEAAGPPLYSSISRRTSPPKIVPIRFFPKTEETQTIYMLALPREAQDDGDQDTYLLTKSVRVLLVGHPTFQKQVRRFQIRLGTTSLGKPFFLEVNLDDQGIYGQTRRDLVSRAEREWIVVGSDRTNGYIHHSAEFFDDPVSPAQSYGELHKLTYKACLISSADHPVIKRGALRKAGE